MLDIQFALSEQEYLLKSWEKFKGNIICEYSNRRWEASELVLLSQKLASEFLDAGLKEGDNVPVLLSNTVAYPVVLMALLYIKCNPLLLHVSTNKVDLNKIKNKVTFKFYIHDFIPVTSKLALSDEEVLLEKQIENINIKLVYDYSPIVKQVPELKGSILHLTSGTSGTSKICIRNQDVAIEEAVNFVSTIDIYSRANIMVTTPLSHAYAYGFGLISAIISDSNLFIDVNFNPRKILKQMIDTHIDILTIVPAMAKLLMKLQPKFPDCKMAKAVFYAGSSCPTEVIEEFEHIFNTKLYAIFGTTETGSISSSFSHTNNFKGVGQTYLNVKVCLTNTCNYEGLKEGAGEVLVSSSSMMQGYYDTYTGKKIEHHATGDIGYFEQGSLILIGRSKDIINVGGLKVAPSEIEEVLKDFPGIEDVVVYSGKTKDGTEKICCAYYAKEKPLDIEKMRDFCRERLSAYKMPRSFFYMEIPRSTSGKYMKHLLPDFNFDNYMGERE